MITDRDTLIFQKADGSETKGLYADFGIKTTSVPLLFPSEIKEFPSRNWADEDGEDVYFPTMAKLQAYDIDISMVYKGIQGTFPDTYAAIFKYMTTEGLELNIFSPYSNTGCKGAYFKGFSDFDFTSDSNLGDIAKFKMKFRVTNPRERFIL